MCTEGMNKALNYAAGLWLLLTVDHVVGVDVGRDELDTWLLEIEAGYAHLRVGEIVVTAHEHSFNIGVHSVLVKLVFLHEDRVLVLYAAALDPQISQFSTVTLHPHHVHFLYLWVGILDVLG